MLSRGHGANHLCDSEQRHLSELLRYLEFFLTLLWVQASLYDARELLSEIVGGLSPIVVADFDEVRDFVQIGNAVSRSITLHALLHIHIVLVKDLNAFLEGDVTLSGHIPENFLHENHKLLLVHAVELTIVDLLRK